MNKAIENYGGIHESENVRDASFKFVKELK